MFTNLTDALNHNRKTREPRLDLGMLGLTGKVPELDQLQAFTWLKVLNFSSLWYELDKVTNKEKEYSSQNKGVNNQLKHLPALPPQLEQLSCRSNQLIDIISLQNLSALINVELHYNQIKDITSLKALYALQILLLSNNELADITPLHNLHNLNELWLHNNQLTDTTSLQGLHKLNILHLENNQLIDIMPLQELHILTRLWLNNNQIQDITSLKDLKKLEILDLRYNPFLDTLPEHIQEKDSLAILRYWLDSRQAKALREAKVVFVGEGGSGKTSLMHRLLYGRQEETTRTEKIEIHTNDTLFTYGTEKEPLKLRFWDFGGQDIMHATHKFFMSNRSLYVLVLHGRKTETEALDNWIEMLKSSIEDSPVLLVVNHLDEDKDVHQLGDRLYQARFPNLVLPVIETSWKTGRGLDKLQEAIQDQLQKMPHFQEDFPVIYQSIKEQLEGIKKPYIDYEEYGKLCTKVAQKKEETFVPESQSLLADILNDLGVMLNFRKRSDKLEDLLIFQPSWIVDGVYQIINAQETQQQKGKIGEETISKLLQGIGYKNNTERRFILDMMKHFKLAYQKENLEKCFYFIPSLFDKNPPDSFVGWQVSYKASPLPLSFGEGKEFLHVRFQYEVWRNDYISYFLEDQEKHIKEGTHWVNGAILQYGEQQARIEAVRHQKHIDIQITGKEDKRYALWRVREALAQIHAMFDEAKLGISMWVIHEEAGKEDSFNYETLKVALECNEDGMFSAVFRRKIPISQLLEGVSLNKNETKEAILKALAYLDKADIDKYFEEMNKVEKDTDQKNPYAKLRREFVDGAKDSFFVARLRTFANEFLEK